MTIRHCICRLTIAVALAMGIPYASAAKIHQAAAAGDVEQVKRLLDDDSTLVRARDANGCTPVMQAISHPAVVRELLRRDSRLDDVDNHGFTVVSLTQFVLGTFDPAWRTRQEESIRSQNASEDEIRARMASIDAAHTEAKKAALLQVQSMLEEAVKVQKKSDEQSPLFTAVRDGDAKALQDALRTRWFVDVRDANDRTPLMHAVLADRHDLARLLLEKGADPRIADKLERNALQHAETGSPAMRALLTEYAQRRSKERLFLFLRDGLTEVDAVDSNGETFLMKFVASGALEEAKILIERGARLDVRNKQGQGLEDVACTRDKPIVPRQQMLDLLKEAGKKQQAK